MEKIKPVVFLILTTRFPPASLIELHFPMKSHSNRKVMNEHTDMNFSAKHTTSARPPTACPWEYAFTQMNTNSFAALRPEFMFYSLFNVILLPQRQK